MEQFFEELGKIRKAVDEIPTADEIITAQQQEEFDSATQCYLCGGTPGGESIDDNDDDEPVTQGTRPSTKGYRDSHGYWSKLNHAVEEQKRNGGVVFMVYTGWYKFKVFPSYEAAAADRSKYDCMAEYVDGEAPVKLYLDLDLKLNDPDSSVDNYNDLLETLGIIYDDAIMAKADRPTKLSSHVIVPSVVFRNRVELGWWVQQQPWFNPKTVDTQVYVNRTFKTVDSIKPGGGQETRMTWYEPTVLGREYEETYVTLVDDDLLFTDVERLVEVPVVSPASSGQEMTDVPQAIRDYVEKYYGRPIERVTILSDQSRNKNNDTLACLLETGDCPIVGYQHQSVNWHTQTVFVNKGRSFLTCRDPACDGRYKVICDNRMKPVRDTLENKNNGVGPLVRHHDRITGEYLGVLRRIL